MACISDVYSISQTVSPLSTFPYLIFCGKGLTEKHLYFAIEKTGMASSPRLKYVCFQVPRELTGATPPDHAKIEVPGAQARPRRGESGGLGHVRSPICPQSAIPTVAHYSVRYAHCHRCHWKSWQARRNADLPGRLGVGFGAEACRN